MATAVTAIIIFIVSLLVWYALSSATCALNGAYLRPTNRWLVPFAILWEDTLNELPGGANRKGQYIRERVGEEGDGGMISATGSWRYKDIREKNLYNEVGKAMLPGLGSYFIYNLFIPFGPVIIYLLFKTVL